MNNAPPADTFTTNFRSWEEIASQYAIQLQNIHFAQGFIAALKWVTNNLSAESPPPPQASVPSFNEAMEISNPSQPI